MKIQLNVIRVQFEVNFCALEFYQIFSINDAFRCANSLCCSLKDVCKMVKALKALLGHKTVSLKLLHGGVQ